MKFRKGYKYQLEVSESWQIDFKPEREIAGDHYTLTKDGWLTLHAGFCWDGASGPVIDRASNYAASAVHDALYRMMRRGELNYKRWREADLVYADVMRKCGAWEVTVQVDLAGLWVAQGSAANPRNVSEVMEAPSGNQV